MSYCLFPIFRIFVRAVFTKNMYMNSQKHVQVFEKTSSCFWSTNYQSFTKESISKDLLYITTRENRYHTIRIHRIS